MKKKNKIVLQTSRDELVIAGDRTFLLFVDETGGETLKDPHFPIFGFGGVGVPAQLYSSNIVTPWLYLKDKVFEGKDKPLHAADLRKPTTEQMEMLNTFFERSLFCRIAAVLSNKTAIDQPLDKYNLVVTSFYKRLCAVLDYTDHDDMIMIFEDSDRGTPQTMDYFSRYDVEVKEEDGSTSRLICPKYIMSKRELEPGLEVADFVAHTAGTSVRSRLNGTREKKTERKDFRAVFKSGDTNLSSFMELTRVSDIS